MDEKGRKAIAETVAEVIDDAYVHWMLKNPAVNNPKQEARIEAVAKTIAEAFTDFCA